MSDWKKPLNVVPIWVTLATIMIEIRPAIKAYSIAVAPLRFAASTFRASRAASE